MTSIVSAHHGNVVCAIIAARRCALEPTPLVMNSADVSLEVSFIVGGEIALFTFEFPFLHVCGDVGFEANFIVKCKRAQWVVKFFCFGWRMLGPYILYIFIAPVHSGLTPMAHTLLGPYVKFQGKKPGRSVVAIFKCAWIGLP